MFPPHDMEAEGAMISAILVRCEGAFVEELRTRVAPTDCYSEAHRRIYEVALDLAAVGQPIDIVTVGTKLRSRQRLEQVGGMGYLTELLSAAPAITDEHVFRYAEIVREKSMLRRIIERARKAIAEAMMNPENPKAFVESLEKDISGIAAERDTSAWKQLSVLAGRALAVVQKRGNTIAGLTTGFRTLDEMTGGLHAGDLTVIAARPGMGKTAFAMGLVANATTIHPDTAACVFELEMPGEQLAIRMVASQGDVSVSRARTGGYSPREWQNIASAMDVLQKRHVYIDDTAGLSFGEIKVRLRRKVRELEREGIPVKVVVVDYLGLVDVDDTGSHALAIGKITRDAKNLAKELGVAFLLLCQLNRKCEERTDKRPIISDLRDSGSIEQDADNIVFIYRDEVYRKEKDRSSSGRSVAELIVAKQRNGPPGTVTVEYVGYSTTFRDLPSNVIIDEPEPGIDGPY